MKNIKDDRQEEKRKKEERRIKRKALNSLYLSFDRRKRGKETAAVCVNRVKARRHMHPLTHLERRDRISRMGRIEYSTAYRRNGRLKD